MRNYGFSRRRIIAALVIIVLLIAAFGLVLHFIEEKSQKDEEIGDTGDWGDEDEDLYLTLDDVDYISSDNVDRYLLIGTDAGGQNLGKAFCGELADFLMLLVVDNTTGKFAFYPIDRNTMVDMEVCNKNGNFNSFATQQICLSHWYGLDDEARNENTVSAVSIMLGGLELEDYYTVSMNDIDRINDAIGGVAVTIDTDMTNVDPAFKKGSTVTLTGDQAEKFLRARMQLKDDTNEARMDRQQQYLDAAYAKIISEARERPEYIAELYTQLEDIIQTNTNEREVSVIANHLIQYEDCGFNRFDGETKMNDTQGDDVEHEEFYVDNNSILENLKKVIDLRVDTESEDEEDEEEE